MARKKDSLQKAALREIMGAYLKENNLKVQRWYRCYFYYVGYNARYSGRLSGRRAK